MERERWATAHSCYHVDSFSLIPGLDGAAKNVLRGGWERRCIQGKYWAVVEYQKQELNSGGLGNSGMVVKTASLHRRNPGSIPPRSELSNHFLPRSCRFQATERVGREVMCR